MKDTGVFKRGMKFLYHVLFQLLLIVMFALCIYFFFHCETAAERLTYIIGTVVFFYIAHRLCLFSNARIFSFSRRRANIPICSAACSVVPF